MGEVFFDNPPTLQGMEADQLQQLYSYLGTMSDKLNQALMSITIEQMAPETQQAIRYASAETAEQNLETTKQLIIKTAQIVRTEMDELRTVLTEQVTAVSEDMGTLESTLQTEITANAGGIQILTNRAETITTALGAVENKQNNLTNYINVGVIDTVGGRDIYGIAIGENVTNPDGTLNLNNRMATFTNEELAFYQNDYKIAYFASNVFHIQNGEVTRSMKMGNHSWLVLSNNALALMAGGGS